MATFEKLIENAKAELKLRAEREAEARAPRVAGRVSQPYAIARPWLSRRQPTLEAPCIPMSTDYAVPAVVDVPTYRQQIEGKNLVTAYSHERAEYVPVRGCKLFTQQMRADETVKTTSHASQYPRRINPGRVAEVRSTRRGPLSDNDAFAIQASRKVKTLAAGLGRSAEIRATAPRNIAARPAARAASARVAPFAFVEKVGAVKGWNVWRARDGYVIVSKSGTVLSIINDAASFVVFAQIWGAVGQ